MRIVWSSAAGVLLALPLLAQPDAARAFTETVNAGGAFYGPENRIVQGSVFRVDGRNLTAGEQSAAFPLPTSLGGTSIQVAAAGQSVDALIISTPLFIFQDGPHASVRAVLPSNAPLGDADLVLTYNGRDSRPLKIRVVKRDFGLYDLVQNVDGPGLIQQNTLEHPARPGQLVGIWGTGLGPVDGDEAATPLPSPLSVPGLEVLVGGVAAKVVYAGRSGCWAGIDQIFFEVPAGVAGCSVAVKVRYPDGDRADAPKTNFGEVSIAVAGSPEGCAGLARPLRHGEVVYQDGELIYSAPYYTGGHASFYTGPSDVLPPMGTCGGGKFRDRRASLEAGAAINLDTPQGRFTLPRVGMALYQGRQYVLRGSIGKLPPGDYALDNGEGATSIPSFRTPFSLPEISFAWTNQDSLSVRPDEALRVTWNGGVPGGGHVVVTGLFSTGGAGRLGWFDDYQGYFNCVERVEKGTFLVPAADMWTSLTRTSDYLELNVFYVHKKNIEVPGLDVAEFVYNLGAYKVVKLR